MSDFNHTVLGKGIIFPFVLVNGAIVVDSDIALIRASIKSILFWPYGTRFYNETYGSKIKELLEEPNDTVLIGLVKHFIIEAISKWETRIRLLEDPEILQIDNKINLRLRYVILRTAQEDSFVFPFYTTIKY